ncbi:MULTISPECIES: hypothetical protein [unclassified Microcoleus]|uniref:hypothetical protein n=1 Tax=unclassified Microcoleus TaxID=2642155 RepID=UPI002FCEE5E9
MTQSDELYQKLLELDEDSLKAQLGIRVQEIARDPTARSASLESLDEALSATPRGGSPDRADVNFGDRYFKQLNVKTHNLMCGELFDDQELKAKLLASFKENSDKGVALLAPILASQFNIALSVAIIAATLIIKTLCSATSTIASATSETICGVWKEKLGDEKDTPDSEGLPVANSLA